MEGDTAQFSMSLTSESTQPVEVSWATADGTAKEGHGLRSEDGNGNVPSKGNGTDDLGADRARRVPRAGGTLPGDSEQSVGGPRWPTPPAKATISDDDVPELSIGDASPVTEGGTARFEVTLTPAHSSQTVTVEYATQGGTATEWNGLHGPIGDA